MTDAPVPPPVSPPAPPPAPTPAPTPAHDWLRPRLERILAEAEGAGIERTVAVAVLTDLVTGAGFNPAHLAGDVDA